jgi:Fuc2NAc and GlcNAc transferase
MAFGLLFFAIVLASIASGQLYYRRASVHGPYAVPNGRSLHRRIVPRGGGAPLAFAVLIGLGFVYMHGDLSRGEAMIFLVGGGAMAAAGYADDLHEIRPRYRILIQISAILWMAGWLEEPLGLDLGRHLEWPKIITLIIAGLWFLNLYNFIDGIDAMASSATIYAGLTMGTILAIQKEYVLTCMLGLVVASTIGFLKFNWPPAKMFLGDAGTSFLSYMFLGVTVLGTCKGSINVWTWLTIFAIYFTDTTVTTSIRFLKFRTLFYRPHRSHAYQNLARVWDSHRKVVMLICAVNLLWVLPLTVAGLFQPDAAYIYCGIVYVPLTAWAIRYGPLFEDK